MCVHEGAKFQQIGRVFEPFKVSALPDEEVDISQALPGCPAEVNMKAFLGKETMKTSSSSCSTGHSQAQLKVTLVSGNALSSILIYSLPINHQRACLTYRKLTQIFLLRPRRHRWKWAQSLDVEVSDSTLIIL